MLISTVHQHMQFLSILYGWSAHRLVSQFEQYQNAEFAVTMGWLYILGTNDDQDIAQDFEGVYHKSVSSSGGLAHSGFSAHADLVLAGLRERGDIPNLKGVVGHSLGGAAAQIIGARYGLPTLTFGSPRVWKRSSPPSAAKEGYHHTRVMNRSDIVVSVPTRWRWKHYEHTKIKFGPHFVRGFFQRLFNKLPQMWHHYPAQYLAGVNKLRGG